MALLLVTAIIVSLGSTVFTLNILSGVRLPTGRAPTDTGEVNLTVQQSISLLLWNDTIDFGVGIVNNTQPCNNATIAIRWDTGSLTYDDADNCWINTTDGNPPQPSHPFTLENDGNENVTLTVIGPIPYDFFTSSGPPAADPSLYNLSWAGENMDNGCTSGLVQTWTAFNGTTHIVCDNNMFGFSSSSDDLAINIKVQIPASGIDTGGPPALNQKQSSWPKKSCFRQESQATS